MDHLKGYEMKTLKIIQFSRIMSMEEQAKNAKKKTNETGSDISLCARLRKVKRYCKSQALSLHNTETLPGRWSSHYLVSH